MVLDERNNISIFYFDLYEINENLNVFEILIVLSMLLPWVLGCSLSSKLEKAPIK